VIENTVQSIIRSILLLTVLLLIPIAPFLIWGNAIEAWVADWMRRAGSPWVVATGVAGILATDVLLPVPSSLVSTFAGARLGTLLGAFASWSGMSLGASIGFALARQWGRPLAQRLSRPEDLDRMAVASQRYGPIVLVVTRALPVLAEASVLLMGIHLLPWKKFLPAILLSNLGIAVAYAAFGTFAQQHEWLALAMGISVALPVLLTAMARIWFRRSLPGGPETEADSARA
jgi:uncharacterized membrane protein YdjX (TVP38/TMEM64 family)